MKKIIIWIIILLVLVWAWVFSFFMMKNTAWNNLTQHKILKDEIEKLNKEDESENAWLEQVDILKKRFSLKWTIMKWDSYFENNQMLLALNEYLKAFRESPDDSEITKKIALVYFELKKFNQAFDYYSKSQDKLNEIEKENMLLSLIYTLDLENKTNIKDVSEKIKWLNISRDEKIYYINSMSCVINFHECKKLFWEYTKNPEVTFSKLLNVKKAIENFENFKTEFIYYKDALIIWALFQDKMYNISSFLWENLLKWYPNYKPILLTTWKWYYELWELQKSKELLVKYFELEPKDVNVAYLLWDINFKLRDYISSNIYYNNALLNWYLPRLDLQRKLIYNHYLLWDRRWMLKIFSYLLEENEANINDFSLWIYHAILEWKTDDAIKWANKWIEKFNWQNWYEVFYWYLWWIERERRDTQKALEYIEKWLSINPRNPLLTLNYGFLEELNWNFDKAMIHFKRTVNVNGEWEFWELALREIEAIEKFLSSQNNSNSWAVNVNSWTTITSSWNLK